MEFLKGLQEALAIGLTKEQYIDVWKTDKIAQGLSLNSDSLLTTGPQKKENAEARATLVDHNMRASSLDVKPLKECNDHFLSSFKYICDQLKENQEQHRLQFQHKHDHMVEEVRSRFNLLSDHISNVADCNTNSLKVYVMQELGLFQQELQQMIQEGSMKHGCDPEQNNIFRKVQDNAGISENRPGESSSKDALDNSGQLGYSKMQEMFRNLWTRADETELDVYQQQNIQNGIPKYEVRSKKGAQNSTPLMNVLKFVSEKEDSNTNDVNVFRNQHNLPLVISGVNTNTVQNTGSIENKMPYTQAVASRMSYAQAIDNQQKQRSNGNISNAGSQTLSGSCSSLNSMKDTRDTPSKSMVKLPSGSQLFRVKVIEPNIVFRSPAMYSSGIPIQATFQGSFDAEGRLHISLHAKSSAYNGNWPLVLSGEGSVYRSASQRFTRLWLLLPTTFQKTTSADIECVFKCEVCLTTSRKKYPDVTYEQLISSLFIENNILTISCALTVIEASK